MPFWLTQLVQFFRFIKNARDRRAAEKVAEREHLIELLDTLFSRLEQLERTRSDAMIAASQAQQAQAEALKVWFEMFKFDSQDRSTAPTVRPADEYDAEQERTREKLISLGYPVDSSPAEQMAWLLAHDHLAI